MNRRAVSAPYLSTSACGSTPLFFDFDIVPMPLVVRRGSPSVSTLAPTCVPSASRRDLDVGRIEVRSRPPSACA